ncbi:MAG: CoA transferase [Deltaproteobacteria bacterium]|nr:CoA transferase [Deltaproteobacteria bacterium]
MDLLKNIKVLDLTRLLPGPLLTLFLADLGAEVIKIEDTEQGDYLRWMSLSGSGQNTLFGALNRDKKGMRLNLKLPEGIEVFRELSRHADVIVEGFRPGVMDRLGVGYPAISAVNPAIVYCSISGYGRDGPYSACAGHDLNYIGVAGALGVTGGSGRPVIPGVQIGDIAGGSLTSFGAIMLGLYNKEKTGRGIYLDISMTDSLLSFMTPYLPYLKTGLKRGEMELTGSIPCYNVYRTKDDRFVTLAALEPKFWSRFLTMIDRTDLMEEQLAKGRDSERVYNELQRVFRSKTRAEWLEFFRNEDVCLAPVNEIDDVLDDPHIEYRGMFGHAGTCGDGPLTIMNPFYRDRQDRSLARAPEAGEHTVEVLRQAGYSEQRIEQLKKNGVI